MFSQLSMKKLYLRKLTFRPWLNWIKLNLSKELERKPLWLKKYKNDQSMIDFHRPLKQTKCINLSSAMITTPKESRNLPKTSLKLIRKRMTFLTLLMNPWKIQWYASWRTDSSSLLILKVSSVKSWSFTSMSIQQAMPLDSTMIIGRSKVTESSSERSTMKILPSMKKKRFYLRFPLILKRSLKDLHKLNKKNNKIKMRRKK